MASAKNKAIKHQIGGARGLMEIHIATPAMVGSKMKYNLHAFKHLIRHSGHLQVLLKELQAAFFQVLPNIVDPATTEIVDYAEPCSPPNQGIDQMGTDKRRTSGHKHIAISPHYNFLRKISLRGSYSPENSYI